MDAYERYLANHTDLLAARELPRECVECGDPADDRELCDTCAVQEVAA
ncbi:hypothetical protein JN535_08400 [Cellulosimicrobium cellulans]|nr:hypothetical protein [Cellulosimicrobium cellulans]MBN0040185.1 hypothetical protein [Cellulosimicrobium cellulans]